MPDLYGENVGSRDSDGNAGKEGICKHKSCVETIAFFIIPSRFNVLFMLYKDKDNSVQVSFISGCHRLTPVFANYPSLSFCRFFNDCHTKYTGFILCKEINRNVQAVSQSQAAANP